MSRLTDVKKPKKTTPSSAKKQIIQSIRQENNALKQELHKKTREFSIFLDAGLSLASTLEFKKVLRIILSSARKLVKCEDWALLLCDDAYTSLRYELVKQTRGKSIKHSPIKIGTGPAGRAVEKGLPILISDHAGKRAELKKAYPHLKVRSLLAFPIVSQNRVIGLIQLINRLNQDDFDKQDLDYLQKLVERASLAIERSDLYQTMSDLAATDDLTKLFNLRYLSRVLEGEMNRSKRYKIPLSLIFIDIDYFKRVNDQHGHLCGSRTLVEMADIFRESFRAVDIIARYGGDEFIVILPDTDVKRAYQVSERVRQSVRKFEFLKKKGLALKITASFGVAGFPDHAENKTDLIHHADQAMYKAKVTGRDKTVLASSVE